MVAIGLEPSERVSAGVALVVLEAMKMEHEVIADADGILERLEVAIGDTVQEGQLLAVLTHQEDEPRPRPPSPPRPREAEEPEEPEEPEHREDLEAVRRRHTLGLDESRPDAVAKRHELNRRTARENIAALCDADTFVEYGPLIVAGQRRGVPWTS